MKFGFSRLMAHIHGVIFSELEKLWAMVGDKSKEKLGNRSRA